MSSERYRNSEYDLRWLVAYLESPELKDKILRVVAGALLDATRTHGADRGAAVKRITGQVWGLLKTDLPAYARQHAEQPPHWFGTDDTIDRLAREAEERGDPMFEVDPSEILPEEIRYSQIPKDAPRSGGKEDGDGPIAQRRSVSARSEDPAHPQPGGRGRAPPRAIR